MKTRTTTNGALELICYYAAGGQFPRAMRVASVEEAERELLGRRYHSAELFEVGSRVPLKTWEREVDA